MARAPPSVMNGMVEGGGGPRLLVLSTLFPNPGQPHAGLFIRERMFRVAREIPLVVVAPIPWFPLQGLVRLFRPHFRPPAPPREVQDGIEIWHPRFLCVPGIAKRLDGLLLASSLWICARRLKRNFGYTIIDAHFAYPDGYAATLLGRWFGVPVTVTLRGTEVRHAADPVLSRWLRCGLMRAHKVLAVSTSLQRLAIAQGVPQTRTQVVGNGVDTTIFFPVPREQARIALKIPLQAKVLVTVGALVERKGFHRVLEIMPALLRRFPDLHYLIVGGSSAEGDMRSELEARARRLGLEPRVHFLGALPPAALREPLSAADVFVLPTRNEGWANVLLEALACGTPVVVTDVGGNAEVISAPALGTLVPFGDVGALREAVEDALAKVWDREAILGHARAHEWTRKIEALVEIFRRIHANRA